LEAMVDPAQEELRAKLEAWRESKRANILSGPSFGGRRPPMQHSKLTPRGVNRQQPPSAFGTIAAGSRQVSSRRPLAGVHYMSGLFGSENDTPRSSSSSLVGPDSISKRCDASCAGYRAPQTQRVGAGTCRPLIERSHNLHAFDQLMPLRKGITYEESGATRTLHDSSPHVLLMECAPAGYAAEMASSADSLVSAFISRGPLAPPPSPASTLRHRSCHMPVESWAKSFEAAVGCSLERWTSAATTEYGSALEHPTTHSDGPMPCSSPSTAQSDDVVAPAAASHPGAALPENARIPSQSALRARSPGSPAGSLRSCGGVSSHSARVPSVPLSPLSLEEDFQAHSSDDPANDQREDDMDTTASG